MLFVIMYLYICSLINIFIKNVLLVYRFLKNFEKIRILIWVKLLKVKWLNVIFLMLRNVYFFFNVILIINRN